MTARDVQKSRVYAAESLVRGIYDRADRTECRALDLHGSVITLPVERRFASIDSIQHYVDLVLDLNWVRRTWPNRVAVPVTVRARNGTTRAHYERESATIAIPPYEHNQAWAMREIVVLHELAHHLAPNRLAAAHGAEFVDRLATLVTEIVGPEAGLLLRTTMHENGVQLTVATSSATESLPADRVASTWEPPDLCQNAQA